MAQHTPQHNTTICFPHHTPITQAAWQQYTFHTATLRSTNNSDSYSTSAQLTIKKANFSHQMQSTCGTDFYTG